MGEGVKGVKQGCNGSPVGIVNLLERVEELGMLGLRIPEESGKKSSFYKRMTVSTTNRVR